jgi:hypothetical protein
MRSCRADLTLAFCRLFALTEGEVPYTSESAILSNHINQKVLQRSRGGSALQRIAYQSCTYYNNGRSHADYSQFAGDHQGGVILLPYGARAEFADECNGGGV